MSRLMLPEELWFMILDFMAYGRPYRIMEEVIRLEETLDFPPGSLTKHFKLENLLMDPSGPILQ